MTPFNDVLNALGRKDDNQTMTEKENTAEETFAKPAKKKKASKKKRSTKQSGAAPARSKKKVSKKKVSKKKRSTKRKALKLPGGKADRLDRLKLPALAEAIEATQALVAALQAEHEELNAAIGATFDDLALAGARLDNLLSAFNDKTTKG